MDGEYNSPVVSCGMWPENAGFISMSTKVCLTVMRRIGLSITSLSPCSYTQIVLFTTLCPSGIVHLPVVTVLLTLRSYGHNCNRI